MRVNLRQSNLISSWSSLVASSLCLKSKSSRQAQVQGEAVVPTLQYNIPELILKAQSLQDKGFFTFNLTATSQKQTQTIKTKVTFADNIEALADLFQLEFQVKVPLVFSRSPERDFATLVSEVLFPSSKDTHTLSKQQRLAEIERIESFCNPIRHVPSEHEILHGILVNRLMTGKFPLNLEDAEGRDAAICQRLFFAALYGLDLRPRHQERYILILPIIADTAQIERTPAIFKNILTTMKASFAQSGIAPGKSLRVTGPNGTQLSSSDSEAEDLFMARIEARSIALKLLPTVLPSNALGSVEFPILTSLEPKPLQLTKGEAALCKYFARGKCTKGKKCEYVHEMNADERRLALSPNFTKSRPAFIESASSSLARLSMTETILELLNDMIAEVETTTQLNNSSAAAHIPQLSEIRPNNDSLPPPYDGSVLFDYSLRKAFPSLLQLQDAFTHKVEGDGDCLFTSFLQATSNMSIGLAPGSSTMALRLMTLQFLKMNPESLRITHDADPRRPSCTHHSRNCSGCANAQETNHR